MHSTQSSPAVDSLRGGVARAVCLSVIPIGDHVEDCTQGGLLVEQSCKAAIELVTDKAVGLLRWRGGVVRQAHLRK